MESLRLADFYRSLPRWPKTKSELTSAAECIAKLLQVPAVAIATFDDEERVSSYLAPGKPGSQIEATLFEEMLKAQFRRTGDLTARPDRDAALVRTVAFTKESAPVANAFPGHQLTVAPIPKFSFSHDSRSGASVRLAGRDPGALIVISARPLDDLGQAFLMAAAQKLAELAAINELEGAIQLRSQFLSIASHELKTPLTSIYGILQLQQRMARMKRDDSAPTPEEEERKRSFLKIMIRQVERLNELIDGLLDVSRIQNGRFQVEPTESDVAGIVRETVNARLTLIAQENGATLQLDVPEHLQATVDPVRMEEVVTNLVMNGIRFSPEGGMVQVRLRSEGDGAFRLTVRDQGPNVPVEDRERIFQPFERAQRTSRLGGLGLGLFISRQIAQLHGGNVTLVESVPGKGNVFEGYFPGAMSDEKGIGMASSA